jgi:hypothetical protein
MAEIIDIRDGGIQSHRGHKVGVILFRLTTGEGKPETLTGYCNPNYRDSIIKSIKRLHFVKQPVEDDTGREATPRGD